MKKFLLLLLFSITAYASRAQVSMGIRAGYTAASMQVTGAGNLVNADQAGSRTVLNGWHADLVLNAPLGANFYLQPVFRYITKGTNYGVPPAVKSPLTGVSVQASSSLEVNYLELPINLLYKLPLGNGKLTGGFGPYVATGLGGRYHYDLVENGRNITSASRKVSFRSGDELSAVRMNAWDFGGNICLGYEFDSGFMLGFNASRGFADVDRSSFTETKNYYYGISVGFLFNREDY